MSAKVYHKPSREGMGTREFKSVVEIPDFSPTDVSEYCRTGDDIKKAMNNQHKHSAKVQKHGGEHKIAEHRMMCKDGARGYNIVTYRILSLPWPISNRDVLYMTYWKTSDNCFVT